MTSITWHDVTALLEHAGYSAVTEVTYSELEVAPVAEDKLSNAAIHTICAYGKVVIRFNSAGDLYSVMVTPGAVTPVTVEGNTISYEIIRKIFKERFPGPADCDEIIYSPVEIAYESDTTYDDKLSGATIWSQCNYGHVGIMFDDYSRLELIEIC